MNYTNQWKARVLVGAVAMSGLTWAGQALALDVPLTCTSVAGVKQRCSLPETTVLTRQDIHAQTRISYTFDCNGHTTGLVLRGDESSTPVQFGGSGATPADLIGYGPFVLKDADPNRTYRATLRGECVVHITTVDVKPSLSQLQNWKTQASYLARIIDAEIGQLKLAKNLVKVIEWDDEQLAATHANVTQQLQDQLPPDLPYASLLYPVPCDKPGKCGQLRDAADMPAGWELAVISNPNLPNLVALRAQIESIKAGRPAYDATTIDRVKAQLTLDVNEATKIIENGTKWIDAIDADLKALVERLKVLRDQSAAT